MGRDLDRTGLSNGSRLERVRNCISIKPNQYTQAVIVSINIWFLRDTTYFYALSRIWRRTLRVMSETYRDAFVAKSRCGPRQATNA